MKSKHRQKQKSVEILTWFLPELRWRADTVRIMRGSPASAQTDWTEISCCPSSPPSSLPSAASSSCCWSWRWCSGLASNHCCWCCCCCYCCYSGFYSRGSLTHPQGNRVWGGGQRGGERCKGERGRCNSSLQRPLQAQHSNYWIFYVLFSVYYL